MQNLTLQNLYKELNLPLGYELNFLHFGDLIFEIILIKTISLEDKIDINHCEFISRFSGNYTINEDKIPDSSSYQELIKDHFNPSTTSNYKGFEITNIYGANGGSINTLSAFHEIEISINNKITLKDLEEIIDIVNYAFK